MVADRLEIGENEFGRAARERKLPEALRLVGFDAYDGEEFTAGHEGGRVFAFGRRGESCALPGFEVVTIDVRLVAFALRCVEKALAVGEERRLVVIAGAIGNVGGSAEFERAFGRGHVNDENVFGRLRLRGSGGARDDAEDKRGAKETVEELIH